MEVELYKKRFCNLNVKDSEDAAFVGGNQRKKKSLSGEFKMSGVTNNNNNEEDKKPSKLGTHINLKVKGQSVDFDYFTFLFDGRRLRAEQTPDELEMEDGDEIDAMLHQTGGSAF
ncbi:hypothetical protein V8G54_032672 [Vigna mungo]|uniref:Ubiquitin-like domain-containing protein n=1 Tax=Vigna mungo TaxID=3915 RepID=A0AAQ3MNB2_VIGMU